MAIIKILACQAQTANLYKNLRTNEIKCYANFFL